MAEESPQSQEGRSRMSPDERTLLVNFLRDLDAARGVAKDPEADTTIAEALRANPNAAYVLVQHAIVADQSLHAAQQRIAELENQLQELLPVPAPAPSFLPRTSSAWASVPSAGYAPPPPEQRPGFFSSNSGLGSFLRNAGTTAAGVAGGEMLFDGLSNLFGGGEDRW
jgi:uncharacterized protein